MLKLKEIRKSWYYLIIVLTAYLILLLANPQLFQSSIKFFLNILEKLIPVFLLIFLLMAVINYTISPKSIIKHLGKESGLKGWLIAIGGGIISHGPPYMWYPLLADLKEKGMRIGLIAAFLYNRSIKIPLIPFMIIYFSWQYVLILTFVMVIISIIQGLVVEGLIKLERENI